MTDVRSIEQFTDDARAFLDANVKRKEEEHFEWGQGPDRPGLLDEKSAEEEQRESAEAKAWRAQVFDAGFGWITGPPEYGGRGLTPAHDRAYREIEAEY